LNSTLVSAFIPKLSPTNSLSTNKQENTHAKKGLHSKFTIFKSNLFVILLKMDGSIIFLPFLIIIVILVLVWIFLMSLKPKKEYGVESVTLRRETVKSIGEKRIADYFERNNIRYVYEKEARSKALFFSYKISNPDFYLPDYDVYVEYWGLVNADDNWTRTKYVRNMKRKMAIYYSNNIKFISIYPRNLENLDWIFRRKFKKVTGFELPN
jgi:hypothetical protein